MFSAHGLVLLSKSAQKVGLPSSFYSIAAVAVPSSTILIDLAVALKCFGVATGEIHSECHCLRYFFLRESVQSYNHLPTCFARISHYNI